MSETPRMPPASARVSVVVIAYNDAEHVGDAVRSALAQGDVVGEVIVVDDASSDTTRDVLAAFDGDPRVRVLAREDNSGGCGTPRNDGIAAAVHPYVMFLDSDDLLLPGAADGLLAAATRHDADVVAGVCVRRELPEGRETTWAARLYDTAEGAALPGTVLDGVEDHPELLLDTLSVNKLYRRAFLNEHGIRFPDGAFHYEDFVFVARVHAAAPRLAVTDVPVYVWHVRRQAATLSISLRRASLANWEHRLAAHQAVVEVFRAAGKPALATAAQTKFLDYDLPMYLRELNQRSEEYRAGWWDSARAYVSAFETEAVASATAPSRWIHGALAACAEPYALGRLVELAAPLPRLIPPYHRSAAGRPVLADAPCDVPLDGLAELSARELPIAVDGTVSVGVTTRLTLTVHDLYGKADALRPASVRVEFAERVAADRKVAVEAPVTPVEGGWTASVRVPTSELVCAGRLAAWSVLAEVRFADGVAGGVTEVRAPQGYAGRRGVVMSRTARILLVQSHVSARRGLILRLADGTLGARRVLSGRLRRLLARR
ncbi:glycosyltransferase family 2 protein [Streptomyces lateritius]|uniref:glycosyltransferase family 2 protein n=1 Tax=Streptomyces lateritius TaxID=67313 RepID=UPI0019A094A7|nr:glycosyltransferase [Streptomyces lateritius]GGU07647.1 hypothetical protein GCM10010272_60980 [Streptomyces lateritius]